MLQINAKGPGILYYNALKEIYYSGSYYDGLKIRGPDEFDLNIVLNPTRLGMEDMITLVDASPGYCKLKISEPFYRSGLRIDEFLENMRVRELILIGAP